MEMEMNLEVGVDYPLMMPGSMVITALKVSFPCRSPRESQQVGKPKRPTSPLQLAIKYDGDEMHLTVVFTSWSQETGSFEGELLSGVHVIGRVSGIMKESDPDHAVLQLVY